MIENDIYRKERIRLALAIISGRYSSLADFPDYQLDLIGYDPYNFSYYGEPSIDEIKEKAEEIIADAIFEEKE